LTGFNTISYDFFIIWKWLTFLGHPVCWNGVVRRIFWVL